ncbi:MAG: FG-GAP-like repeat-containing protein [Bacteroidales bacterium]|nr:FG-GAP-like repeat-containing protein [Bacteroidales bacterium]
MKRFISVLLMSSMLSTVVAAQTLVGSMGGQFAVNEMGAATYTLPFDIPEGVNGMQPNIGLIYNSQSGNGIAGMGVSIYGISVISKAAKDIYHDESFAGFSYVYDAPLSIDGSRMLLKTGSNGVNGAEYCAENSPYEIISIKQADDLSKYFVVKLKNGTTAYYGQTSDSKANCHIEQRVLGSTTGLSDLLSPYAWYLDRMEDSFGNYITYTYSMVDNTVFLTRITYGSSSSGLTNTIDFAYEYRTDHIEYVMTNGLKTSVCRRLKDVTISTNGTKRNKYTLTYYDSYYFSRLKSITESYGDRSLPSVTFDWRSVYGSQMSHEKIDVDMLNLATDGSMWLSSGDILGKGKSSLVALNKKATSLSVYEYIKDNGAFSYTQRYVFPSGTDMVNKTSVRGICYTDYDGDGTEDIVMPFVENANFGCFISNSKSTELKKRSNVLNTKCDPLCSAGNIYNNGRGQIVFLENKKNNDGLYTYSIYSYSNSNPIKGSLHFSREPKKMVVADCNNDGLQDMIVLYESGYTIYWNEAARENDVPFSYSPYYCECYYDGSDLRDASLVQAGDFNGDGIVDFISNSSDSEEFYLFLGDGRGRFTKKSAFKSSDIHEHSFTGKDDERFVCNVIDFDNDGKQDVIITKAKYKKVTDKVLGIKVSSSYGKFEKTYTCWMKSTGVGFTEVKRASSNKESDADAWAFLTGDFNGDGFPELVNYGYNCYSSTDANVTPSWHIYKNSLNNCQANKISRISTSNNGAYTDIEYSNLSDKTVYAKTQGDNFPVSSIMIPLNVVKQTKETVAGYTYSTSYTYKGLRCHMQGKGLIGFSSVTSKNATTGETRTLTVNALSSSCYEPSSITNSVTMGGFTSNTVTTYASSMIFKKCHFTYPSKIIDTDIYGNSTTCTNTYDSSKGYLTKTRTEYGSSSMYRQTEYSSYVKAGGVWQPQTVISTQKHSDSSTIFSQKTTYTYDTSTGKVLQEKQNAGATMPVTNDYTYDQYGNVKTHKISATGITSVTTSFEYDETHRFVTRKKNDVESVDETFVYDIWGNLLSATDEASNKTSYSYDAIGNLTKTTYPDGTSTAIARGWGTTSTQRYYVMETATGQAPVTVWYDNCGREVKTDTYGEKGVRVTVTKAYGKYGSITNETTKTGEVTVTRSWSYDTMGRVSYVVGTNTPYTSYSYSNRKETISDEDNDIRTTTTYDAWGNVKTITDEVSSAIYTYASNGSPSRIESGGATYSMTYYEVGNQKTLSDPDAGTTTYVYDALGRVKKSTDAKNVTTTYDYDKYGNLIERACGDFVTKYTYGTSKATRNQLQSETANGQTIKYTYDRYGRLESKTYVIDGESFKYSYTYNSKGQLEKKTCPIGNIENYIYDSYGNIVEIRIDGSTVWNLDSYTGRSRVSLLGATMKHTTSFSTTGLLEAISLVKINVTPNLMNLQRYTFDGKRGNLMTRYGVNNTNEDFEYDKADRLVKVKNGSTEKMKMVYSGNGNISEKTDVGVYSYGSSQPHAVRGVSKQIATNSQEIVYTPFNKVSTVTEKKGGITFDLSITYGPDLQRVKTVLTSSGQKNTRIYAGSYERVKLPNGNVIQYQYLDSPDGLVGVYVKENSNSAAMQYALTDHQGSILALYKPDFTTTYTASYDVWGKRTVTKNNISFQRGYTGHEHWNSFQLIDMNGRFYDPILARFLSPDPYVQAPDNTQNFNRYSYCLNNPLKYTDPNGEFWEMVIFGAIYGAIYNGAISDMNGKGFWKGAWKGALVGAASSALGCIAPMGNTWYGSVGWGSIVGTSSGIGNCWAAGCNSGREYMNGAWKGVAIGGVMGFLTCEQFGNLTRGKGFNTNEGVLQNFKNGVYDIPEGSTWQQEVLDYFGFEGKYVNKDGNASYERNSATIRYRNYSFDSYSELKMSYLKESFHKYRHQAGLMSWGDTKLSDIDRWPEEYEGAIYLYKSQGLHCNKVDLGRIEYCESMLNLHNNFSYNQVYKFESFRIKWTDFIYKIPRRW